MTVTTNARAWAIRRQDGVTLGFTDHDAALHFDGIAFRPDQGMTARALVQAAGLSVDNTEAEGALNDDAITERDILAGRWDDAELRMWDVDWTDPVRRRLMFRGSLGEVTRLNGAFRAELRGLSEPLNLPQGRAFHPGCAARLGDAACGVDVTNPAFFCDLAVQTHDDGRVFDFTGFPAFDAHWFEHGRVVVLSGAAQGLHAAVKNDEARPGGARRVELWQGLGILPAPGDQLRLIAGCDKRAATCRLKFSNMLNFRGFPHLPPEDWLMAPQIGGKHG
ncbi:DUF2163 domain-containing protein [Paracoccus sp. (in: a-proteobacteria)]|uniref:DUF2163 domain-containing protein n=1 Tax=Paracoccus sp. TaxID=267 RepID=UPI0026DEDDCA|nr:DUF2163 domain-containing protein [Paracoccus sp. (in: a-proteobacteria)]MDO5647990.1 DUF2163 domain-containing protein [Paracoccus sp. (in: a-proteobacteria)]